MLPSVLALALATQMAGGFARPDLLVTTAWVSDHLRDPNVRIVDMRPRGYADGHIPGAVWLDNNAIRIPTRPPVFLPSAQEFESLMARLGISNGTRVVVYDERGGIYAARLWAVLAHYGHENVALVDGGWTQWAAESRPTETEAVAPPPGRFLVKPGRLGIATADDVRAAINTPTRLVDARTPGEIDGTDLRGIRRGGFIESSIPVYWEDTLQKPSVTFRSPAEIAALWRSKGIAPADGVITYCQVGMRASHDAFTLALIGHDLASLRVYYGSWEEWGSRDDTPIRTRQ